MPGKKKRKVTWNTRLAASGSDALPKVVALHLENYPELAKRLREFTLRKKCNSYPEALALMINQAADTAKIARLLSQVEKLGTDIQAVGESVRAL